MKYYRVEFSDGSMWNIPLSVIVHNRVEYLTGVTRESIEVIEEEVLDEFKDSYNVGDWAQNNMDWADVVEYAVQVIRPSTDYEVEWSNAKYQVIGEDECQ